MEWLIAIAIGVITAVGVYLVLGRRTFPVVMGLTMLTYATNLFLFSSGRLVVNQPAIVTDPQALHVDPVPQALVLTAIVISFGMTALILVLAVRGYFESGADEIDLLGPEEEVARGRT